MLRFTILFPAVVLASLGLSVGPAAAAAPEKFGPFVETAPFTVDCGDFEASVTGTVTTRFHVFADDDGKIVKFQQFVQAPRDVWTNTETGASIVVRGQFQQTATRIPGTDEFSVSVVGHRYLVNKPGEGVVVQDVGRIVYEDLSEETVVSVAGQHDLADRAAILPVFCGELE